MSKLIDLNHNSSLPSLPSDLHSAADAQWNQPIPAAVTQAVSECEKANRSLMQLLDTCPVTAAMQFAVAYGWSLREQVEKAKRRLTI